MKNQKHKGNTARPLLTPNEKAILTFLQSYILQHQIAPTLEEVRRHFGFASLNSVQRYFQQLQAKGYISLLGGNRKRSIQLLAHNTKNVPSTTPQPPISGTPREDAPQPVESLSLPLLGRVAAGGPIEAILDGEAVEVPASFVRYPTKTFALLVEGDSMIEEGIQNGDVIFVQKQSYAPNGAVVVATVSPDTQDSSTGSLDVATESLEQKRWMGRATVKKFYLHRDIHSSPQGFQPNLLMSENGISSNPRPKVELRPANSSLRSMWFDPGDVHIEGVVVALLRRYM